MIRKLLLPTLAAALLGACATGYDYRGGGEGDYYYGQPSVDYYGGYYGGYGYPGWSGMMGFGYGYGGYGYGGYGYPYYGYGYPYYPPVIIVRPDHPRPGPGPQRPGQRPPGSTGPYVPSPGPQRPGQRLPGSTGPYVPSPLHGRGHSWSPPSVTPMPSAPDPVRGPRLESSSYPQERIRREPSQPMLRGPRERSRPERDSGLIPPP